MSLKAHENARLEDCTLPRIIFLNTPHERQRKKDRFQAAILPDFPPQATLRASGMGCHDSKNVDAFPDCIVLCGHLTVTNKNPENATDPRSIRSRNPMS